MTSMFLVFFSLEMQRRLVQTKVHYKLWQFAWKETSHKLLKVAAAKKSFPSVYIIDITCFDECFLFHVVTGRRYFYTNYTQRFGETATLLRSLKQVFWKKSAFYMCFLHYNNAANTEYPQKKFLLLKFVNSVFFAVSVCDFLYKRNF